MADVTTQQNELGASWFADTHSHLHWANWLDPGNRNNAGWAGVGTVRVRVRHRDPHVDRNNVHAEGLRELNAGHAPDFETADRLARAALAAGELLATS